MNKRSGKILSIERIKNVTAKVYILILWCGITATAQGNQRDSLQIKKRDRPDSLYYKTYTNKLQVNTKWGSQFQELQTWYPGDYTTILRPNETYSLSFGVSYEWLDISYSYSPPFLNFNNDNDTRGETRQKSLSVNANLNRWNVQADISRTNGFYLYNTKDYVPDWQPGDAYLVFPHLYMDQATLLLGYKTNSRFSLQAISGGTRRQIQSTWTLLPTLALQYFSSNLGDSINSGSYTLQRNYDFNLIVPAMCTWVLGKKTFISAGAGPSIGLDYFTADVLDSMNTNIRATGTRLSHGYLTRLSIGYNNERFFVGVQGILRKYTHNNGEEDRLSKVFYSAKLFMGYRFDPPRFLSKGKQWLDQQVESIFHKKKAE